MSAQPCPDANDFPVLHALETWRGTPWGRLQPGLEDIAQAALAPTTRRLQLGEIGCVTDWYYAELPSHLAGLPLWCEGVTPFIPPHNAKDNALPGRLEDAVFDALYGDTPIGILLTRDPDVHTAVSASFISLPFPTMPVGAPARVVVDLAAERDDEDNYSIALPLADFHRARCGLPLAAEATTADLIAAESRAVLVEDRRWLRSRVGGTLPRCFLGDSLPSNRGAGLKTLRAAHARTFVEHVPHALGEEAEGVDMMAFTAKRLDWVVTAGPHLATTVIAAAAEKAFRS